MLSPPMTAEMQKDTNAGKSGQAAGNRVSNQMLMTFSENISIKNEEATENYELIVIHKDKENTSSLQVGPVPTAQRPPKI